MQDFIRSEYNVKQATRSAPTSTVGNAVRRRKRSEIRIYVSIPKHSQANARSRTCREHTVSESTLSRVADIFFSAKTKKRMSYKRTPFYKVFEDS